MRNDDEVTAMLDDIDHIRETNRSLGTRKLRSDYELLLRFVFIGLSILYFSSSGYKRSSPGGADLLFYIYLSRILGNIVKK
jgi:hypothetical protein